MNRESLPPVLWEPQPGPQYAFCEAAEEEVLYGGAAGGGKSDALLMNGLRQIDKPEYRAIFFRRTTRQLTQALDRSRAIFRAVPGARMIQDGGGAVWKFPSGAKYILTHLEKEDNKFDHDGIEYHYIAFDELTHFTESQYLYFVSRLRSGTSGMKLFIRSSAMPVGRGITWVRKRFVSLGNKLYTDKKSNMTRRFIPARLEDNKILQRNSPNYEYQLQEMGPKLYRALRFGDWDVVEGAAFEELDMQVHGIAPHVPPYGVQIHRALDWGYAKPFCVLWFYKDHDGRIVVFKEWYGGEDNRGLRMGVKQVAREILGIEKSWGLVDVSGTHPADPAIWAKSNDTPSIAQLFDEERITWTPAINDRVNGKAVIHSLLRADDGGPNLLIATDCKHVWRTLPVLQADPRRPEDVDSSMEDHAYDALRYAVMHLRHGASSTVVIPGEDIYSAGAAW